jgi:hypothetical protein
MKESYFIKNEDFRKIVLRVAKLQAFRVSGQLAVFRNRVSTTRKLPENAKLQQKKKLAKMFKTLLMIVVALHVASMASSNQKGPDWYAACFEFELRRCKLQCCNYHNFEHAGPHLCYYHCQVSVP